MYLCIRCNILTGPRPTRIVVQFAIIRSITIYCTIASYNDLRRPLRTAHHRRAILWAMFIRVLHDVEVTETCLTLNHNFTTCGFDELRIEQSAKHMPSCNLRRTSTCNSNYAHAHHVRCANIEK